MHPARIHYYCRPFRRRRAGGAMVDAYDVHCYVDLPFIPQAGMHLKIARGGDFYVVDQVMCDATAENGDTLLVFLEEPDDSAALPTWREMRLQGWLLG